ncbi:hypothetical protein CLOLEP_02838 [[Clostridium] leptum DSM 753]|uniref:Uncharacterized protein n=1 Tax=[Clostridium] leptum DSM 753 TaxID=428125 RepID=A7VW74_9FIRM|nr:hypothetical protein CLOLEP_02838 [[Clostridium] leptum DSM 753]
MKSINGFLILGVLYAMMQLTNQTRAPIAAEGRGTL